MRNSIGTSSLLTVSQRITRTVFSGDAAEEQPERDQKRQRDPRGDRNVSKLAHPLGPQNGNRGTQERQERDQPSQTGKSDTTLLLDPGRPQSKPQQTRIVTTHTTALLLATPLDPRLNRMGGLDTRWAQVRIRLRARQSARSARPLERSLAAGSAVTLASRMSCQSVTSSDDRRL